jgi:hypothetical protein
MNSLFNITARAKQLALALEEGELTQDLENELVINQNELQIKAENYGYVIKSLEGDVTIIDEEIKRLRGLKEAKTNAIERMKEAVVNAFQVYGITEVKSPTLKLSLRRSESVEVINQDQLPECFVKAKTNAIERMKGAVENAFQIYGITEVKSPTLKLSLRRSESVEVINHDQLPEAFVKAKTTYTPDKGAIKDAIKSGLTVEGAVLVENLNLQIK